MSTTRRAAANAAATDANTVSQEIARQLQERENEEREGRGQIAPGNWQMPVGNLVSLGNGAELEPEEPEEQSPADRVLSMLSDVNAQGDARAIVKVSRVNDDGTIVWCKDYPASQFEQGGYEMIRRQWGPGEYKVVLYGMVPGTKRFTIRTKAEVTLAAPLVDDTPTGPAASPLESLVAQLAAGQQAIMQALNERPAPVDQMAQMTQMFGMMKLMREAMGDTGAPKSSNTIKEIIESIQAITEVKDLINPPAVPETPMGMVSQMLPLLQTAMQQRGAQPQQQPQQAPRVSLPHPPAAVQPNPTPILPAPKEGEEVNPVAMLALRGHLATLVQMAKDDAPVEDGAALIYEHIPDDFIALLQQPNWFDLLKMVTSPEIEGQKDWLTKARDAALAEFEKPDEEAAPAAQAAG